MSARARSSLTLQTALERGAYLRAGAVQEHALVALREAEQVARLFGRSPDHVAQHQHLALAQRKRLDRLVESGTDLAGLEPRLRVAPARRRAGPPAGAGVAGSLEALRRDRRVVVALLPAFVQ